jgi:adenine-specific DNA-methyltransferase
MQLTRFNEIDFLPALKEFFGKSNLNVPINYVDDKPVSAKKILQNTYKDNEAFRLINDVYFVGLVDDAAFRGNQSLAIDNIKSDYDGILIFGVTLNNRDHGQLPTRSHLAEISRAFNREFYYTPVVVVFKYNDANSEYLAFANTERLKYKDNREGEKAGKVTLLRDIDIRQPHSGHERILAELAIPTTGKDRVDSFAKLYAYWQKVLDVSLLNKQFYQEISTWYFHACKQVVFPFPKDAKNAQESLIKYNQESLIRLITRLMFVWFLKEKGLVPNQLFNKTDIDSILKSVEPQESTYYKAILQNLFFATLNTEDKRKFIKESSGGRNSQHMIHNVFRYKDYFQDPDGVIDRYFADIPFLNGGLFECLDVPSQKDKPDTEKRIDGFSNHSSNVLSVPNELFFDGFQDVDLNADFGTSRKKYRVRGLLEIFKSYKFTIAENTPFEEDVALDPELLGQVFENLLAAYNPETQTTARKQTGSFYTPRKIVNYMVDESLIAYFKEKLKSKQEKFTEQDFDKRLRLLLDYQSSVNSFEDDSDVTLALIESIDNCKILDPACGSGAFPMGILQKMVYVLSKLDHKNLKWQELQRLKVQEETNRVFYIADKDERQRRLIEINEAFDESMNDPNYGRKLFLIENCIYGVDIQPIALQIAKLRCFIALIVEQVVDRNKKNSGILPLPNLETKFVAANSLIRFSDQSLRSDEVIEKEQELKEIRKKHFTARSKATKDKYRERDHELRNEIRDLLKGIGLDAALADSLAQWNPYNQNASANFFDPEWMFGISNGFDVVIGNPPYGGALKKKEVDYFKQTYTLKTSETAILFIEKGIALLKPGGLLAYIVPKSYSFASNYAKTRDFTINELTLTVDCGKAFKSVLLEAMVFVLQKGSKQKNYNSILFDDKSFQVISNIEKSLVKDFGFILNGINEKEICIGLKMIKSGIFLDNIANNSRGEAFQKFIDENCGDYGVIGGAEINQYGIRGIKGYIDKRYVKFEKGYIKKHSLLAQNIVAHIKYPFENIKIICCIPDTTDYLITDTINQISITDKSYSQEFVWAILKSNIVNWFAYYFIFGKAIRTMHFDAPITSRIPIPIVSESAQVVIKNLVQKCIKSKDKERMMLETEIDEYIANLYGLTSEEISIVNGG